MAFTAEEPKQDEESGGRRGRRDRGPREGREGRESRGPREREESEFIEKLVSINRVSKTVKGGKRFGFAALMVVGDGKGRVGFGTGKAREVPEAVAKATADARRHMIRVPLREARTLHHDTFGRCGAGRVILRSAAPGTGIIAGGPLRAVFEALGIQDVVAKAIGSNNPHSMVNATFDALQNMQSPRQVAARRSKKVGEIVAHREAALSAAEAAVAAENAENEE